MLLPWAICGICGDASHCDLLCLSMAARGSTRARQRWRARQCHGFVSFASSPARQAMPHLDREGRWSATPLPGLGGGPRDGPGQSGRPGAVQMPSEINVCRSMQCLTLDMRALSLMRGCGGVDWPTVICSRACGVMLLSEKGGTDKPCMPCCLRRRGRGRINPGLACVKYEYRLRDSGS